MSTLSAIQSSINGIQSGVYGANKAASNIANAGADFETMTSSLVEMNNQLHQVEASAKALQTSQDMIGSLLDITV